MNLVSCFVVHLLLLSGALCTLTRLPSDTLFLSGGPLHLNCSSSLPTLSWKTGNGTTIFNGSTVFDSRFSISTTTPSDLLASNINFSFCGKFICADTDGSYAADVSVIDGPVCVVNATSTAANSTVTFVCSANYCGIVTPLIYVKMAGITLYTGVNNFASYSDLSGNIINPVTCLFNNQVLITCPRVNGSTATTTAATAASAASVTQPDKNTSKPSAGSDNAMTIAIIAGTVGGTAALAIVIGVIVIIIYRFRGESVSSASAVGATPKLAPPPQVQAAPPAHFEQNNFASSGLDQDGLAAIYRPYKTGLTDRPASSYYVYNSAVHAPDHVVYRPTQNYAYRINSP